MAKVAKGGNGFLLVRSLLSASVEARCITIIGAEKDATAAASIVN